MPKTLDTARYAEIYSEYSKTIEGEESTGGTFAPQCVYFMFTQNNRLTSVIDKA